MSTVSITGNLPTAPDLRYTPAGKAVASLTVLENVRRKDEAGTWVDGDPNSYPVEVWGDMAENVAASCVKGSRVTIQGRLRTDRHEDSTTGDRRIRQVVVAEEVGLSLRFHTASAAKANRSAKSEPNQQQE